MKVVLLDLIGADELAALQELAPTVDLIGPRGADDDLVALVSGAQVIVSRRRPVTNELMEAAGGDLGLIQLWSNRRDHVDLDAARRHGLKVALMPQVGCIAVAELALLLMLGLTKKVVPGHAATVSGAYRDLGVEPFRTEERKHNFQWMKLPDLFELNGCSLGLVGFGEIGTEVARRARAFGMTVSYYKRERLDPAIEAEEEVSYLDLPELLATSDIVSLHVPLTENTEQLIDRRAFEQMKSTAYIVNTCRGGVIDEDDLVNALETKQIAGAGLDVFLYEPIPHDHPLLRLDNVLLTPHLGGGSGGARIKHARNIMVNISRFSAGEPVEHLILGGSP